MTHMKKTKKFLGLLLSLIVAAVLVFPAFATEATYTITAPDNGHTYEVYQIFTGDLSSGTLSNVKWGANGTGTAGAAVSSDVITTLTRASGSDAEKLAVITPYVNLESEAFGTAKYDASLEVPAGYYLIKDVNNSQTGADDSYTLYLVEVADDVTITPKSDVPTFSKKVQDTNDTAGTTTGWQDSADYDIGDTISFQLSGTVADDYASYTTYKFAFHDTESAGLTFIPSSVVVAVGGTTIDESNYSVVTSGLDDGCTFEVVFANLKDIASVGAGSVITVTYQSTLNENAVIGSDGNPNTAYLEFSNNPNAGQGGETGKTPEDTVTVFTYEVVINKVDSENAPLTGAAFKLEKQGPDGSYTVVKEFTVSDTDPASTFTFSGLDDGTYRLTETTTPAGYNTIDPIEFTIAATHTDGDTPALTALTGTGAVADQIAFTASTEDGSLTADVVNQSGATLPETGGIGTTLFYVLGGVLAAGAGILLVAKKRMNAAEDK